MKSQIRQRSNWIRGQARGSRRERQKRQFVRGRNNITPTGCEREFKKCWGFRERRKKSQVGEICSLIVSPSDNTVYWPTHTRARFVWQRWLEFGHHYSVYYRVIVMATALSASWEDSGYQTHSSCWWKNRDVCYDQISKQVNKIKAALLDAGWVSIQAQDEKVVWRPATNWEVSTGGTWINTCVVFMWVRLELVNTHNWCR